MLSMENTNVCAQKEELMALCYTYCPSSRIEKLIILIPGKFCPTAHTHTKYAA